MKETFSLSEEETFEQGSRLASELRRGALILLSGELGAGKTVFARGVAAGLGVRPEDVSSPTFTLVQEYEGGRMPIFHVDLYRLHLDEEVGTLGIDEILQAGGVVIVEWAEKLPQHLRSGGIVVRLEEVGEGSRRIVVERAGAGERADA